MVEDQGTASLCTSQQHWEQAHADDHVHLARHITHVHTLLGASSAVPAVEVHKEYDIVYQSVCDGNLDSRHHSALLLALGILFPRATIFRDHADELLVAGHNGRNCGDQTGAEHEITQAGDVEECAGITEAGGEEVRLDVGCGECVEDVETPSEDVEGDREVHDGRMKWESFMSVSQRIHFDQ